MGRHHGARGSGLLGLSRQHRMGVGMCCGLDCVPSPNSYIEALTPNLIVFVIMALGGLLGVDGVMQARSSLWD